ncbi:S8 family serine peptidase [Desulfovibrio sulfodismutans]|uniref:S8 family serine peptidase n=1 Tax=Desulfolutivibrio sulfodismutans TaxID=63561 RepID=A0A7K3NRW6_9BACT|nr:S8 family serine peptidase [Desulfolutivibrio sulfodismutans]NDY58545.1 S8 family serine peptidase [Desulfolutivibrio sulfodismutans]QLA13912.1 S8 family serine peptidase [Desulfolutivibrio sulfodismutans DSM 3696]
MRVGNGVCSKMCLAFALVLFLMSNSVSLASDTPKRADESAVAAVQDSSSSAVGLSAAAMENFKQQVKILNEEKKSLTPVQKKINSAIVRTLHGVVLKDRKSSLPMLETSIKLTESNEIMVDIKADVTDDLLAFIKAQGGTIINSFPQYKAIRAQIPITAVETIAAQSGVRFIDKAQEYILHKSTTTEGDVAHSAPTVRTDGYTGAGVKIGVISDSVDYLANLQATGDLPATVTVLQDSPGQTGEGTAMLEIVYDLAPSASLYFATAQGGMAGFANNIIALKDAGCKVIVDDVGYFAESPFQDDVISQAVTTVADAGAFYFSSAANDGNLHSNTSGTYEGDYNEFLDGNGVSWHAYSGSEIHNTITDSPSVITLQWSDPLGGSANDYDLYLLDSAGTVYNASTGTQDGTQDPYEQINVGADLAGYKIAIQKFTGEARFLHLSASRGSLTYSTNGATKGHSTVEKAFGVAAVSAAGRTTAFTGTEAVETFSSDGPRRIFYNPDGSAITPGNFLASGGQVRQKPDITAADCVATSWPGHTSFCGTSAAAPHAAAIAGLLVSAKSAITYTEMFNALTSTALPSPPSWTDYFGLGVIMADRAYASLHIGSGTKYLPGLLLLLE